MQYGYSERQHKMRRRALRVLPAWAGAGGAFGLRNIGERLAREIRDIRVGDAYKVGASGWTVPEAELGR